MYFPSTVSAAGLPTWIARDLQSANHHRREVAARELATIAAPESVEALITLLGDPQLSIRRTAAFSLKAHGTDASAAVPHLIEQLNGPHQHRSQSDEKAFKAAMLSALGAIGPAAEVAVPAIEEHLDNNRAVAALVEISTPLALERAVEHYLSFGPQATVEIQLDRAKRSAVIAFVLALRETDPDAPLRAWLARLLERRQEEDTKRQKQPLDEAADLHRQTLAQAAHNEEKRKSSHQAIQYFLSRVPQPDLAPSLLALDEAYASHDRQPVLAPSLHASRRALEFESTQRSQIWQYLKTLPADDTLFARAGVLADPRVPSRLGREVLELTNNGGRQLPLATLRSVARTLCFEVQSREVCRLLAKQLVRLPHPPLDFLKELAQAGRFALSPEMRTTFLSSPDESSRILRSYLHGLHYEIRDSFRHISQFG